MPAIIETRRACEEICSKHTRLHALIHNAGALSGQRKSNEQGVELTTAVQVVGPFLMTGLLLDRLANAEGSRVITMSSGGMYLAKLSVRDLQMGARSYRGAEQYARVKRALVTLNEMWAERAAPLGIRFHAQHPGWVDTPGIQSALPVFRSFMRPLLRTAVQGADTPVWLTLTMRFRFVLTADSGSTGVFVKPTGNFAMPKASTRECLHCAVAQAFTMGLPGRGPELR